MLPTRHFQRSAAILARLLTFIGITLVEMVAFPPSASAEPTDDTLTVIVNRDIATSNANLKAILTSERLKLERQVGLSGFVKALREGR